MRLLLSLIFLLLGPRTTFPCTGRDIANFEITLDAALAKPIRDFGWRNQLSLLDEINYAPQRITLSIPRQSLEGGRYPTEADFRNAIRQRLTHPISNLVLRKIAQWLQWVMESQPNPDAAGISFALATNIHSGATVRRGPGNYQPFSLEEGLREAISPELPSLEEMKQLEGGSSQYHRVFSRFYLTHAMTANSLEEPQSSSSGRAASAANRAISYFARFGGELLETRWAHQPEEGPGYWWLPSRGSQAGNSGIAAAAIAHYRNEEVGVMVRVPAKVKRLIEQDAFWFTRIAYPLVEETPDSTRKFNLGGLHLPPQRISLPPEREYLFAPETRHAMAVAFAIQTSNALVQDEERRLAIFSAITMIMQKFPDENFSTIDAILRHLEIPVWLVANPELRRRGTRVWPNLPQFHGKVEAPTRTLYILFDETDKKRAFREWGLSEETNARWLETATGVLL